MRSDGVGVRYLQTKHKLHRTHKKLVPPNLVTKNFKSGFYFKSKATLKDTKSRNLSETNFSLNNNNYMEKVEADNRIKTIQI